MLGLAAAAALLVIVALAAALSPGPIVDEEHPAATPTPEGRDLFGGTLEPNVRYRTTEFLPRLSFEVTDDRWMAVDTTLSDELRLARVKRGGIPPGPEAPRIQQLVFLRVTEVADPSVRGRGHGAAVLAELHRQAVLHGVTEVELHAQLTARGFYERGGWRPDGVERDSMIGPAVTQQVRYARDLP